LKGTNYPGPRTGLYPLPLPFTPGAEAAGTVESIGSEVSDIAVGDRVAYAMIVGSYAEYAAVPASRLVKMPEGIDAQAGGDASGHDGALPVRLDLSSEER
jgi:NADPH2:quinone reductase